MMYGPFSAAYAGNSMGAVMEITTRLPDKLAGRPSIRRRRCSVFDSTAPSTFGTSQTTADRRRSIRQVLASGRAATIRDSQQPAAQLRHERVVPHGHDRWLSRTEQAGCSGEHPRRDRLAAHAHDEREDQGCVRHHAGASRDVHVRLLEERRERQASTRIGSVDQTDVRGPGRFRHRHSTLSSRRTRRTASRCERTRDATGTSSSSAPRTTSATISNARRRRRRERAQFWHGRACRGARRHGLGDARREGDRGVRGRSYRQDTRSAFGVHAEHYRSQNTTYNTPTGGAVSPTRSPPRATARRERRRCGRRTRGASRRPLGYLRRPLRELEGFDGFNVNGTYDGRSADRSGIEVLAEGALSWMPSPTGNFQRLSARRIASRHRAELYQLVSTGTTFTSPNPNLKPDNVLAAELRVERTFDRAQAQLSLFQDDVHDAIISQFLPLVANSTHALLVPLERRPRSRARRRARVRHADVVRPRARALGQRDLCRREDARAVRPCQRDRAGGQRDRQASAEHSEVARDASSATYRPDERLALTSRAGIATRCTRRSTTPTCGSTRIRDLRMVRDGCARELSLRRGIWSAAIGVDNLLDRKYFLFHPFPQRTLIGSAKFTL